MGKIKEATHLFSAIDKALNAPLKRDHKRHITDRVQVCHECFCTTNFVFEIEGFGRYCTHCAIAAKDKFLRLYTKKQLHIKYIINDQARFTTL